MHLFLFAARRRSSENQNIKLKNSFTSIKTVLTGVGNMLASVLRLSAPGGSIVVIGASFFFIFLTGLVFPDAPGQLGKTRSDVSLLAPGLFWLTLFQSVSPRFPIWVVLPSEETFTFPINQAGGAKTLGLGSVFMDSGVDPTIPYGKWPTSRSNPLSRLIRFDLATPRVKEGLCLLTLEIWLAFDMTWLMGGRWKLLRMLVLRLFAKYVGKLLPFSVRLLTVSGELCDVDFWNWCFIKGLGKINTCLLILRVLWDDVSV